MTLRFEWVGSLCVAIRSAQFDLTTTAEEPIRRKAKEQSKGLRKSISSVFTEIVEEMKASW
jgi:hypothetical protein